MSSMQKLSWDRDSDHIAHTLGLRKSGAEYKGPCPVCGGTDRFHIKQGRSRDLIMHCRHGCTFAQLMHEFENRGLAEKGEWIRPKYRQSDLDFCDTLLIVGAGNLETNQSFHADDVLKIANLIRLVDPQRQYLLRALMDRIKERL